jgi:C-terminal processing protease CtpA/Prc
LREIHFGGVEVWRGGVGGTYLFQAFAARWWNPSGPLTISAGETFTQALMGHSPHIVRETTQGVFSDVLGHQLPNGWRFGLPNEIYRTADGTIFDLVGIPPDIEVPVFADADVAAGKDPAMARGLEILSQQITSQ